MNIGRTAAVGIGLLLAGLATGCAPSTFVRAAPGWKVVELREGLDYDDAWMIVVDTITRDWDVEMMDKGSGYMRTAWHHGIAGGPSESYRGRITVKFPTIKTPTTAEMKTEAQWLVSRPGGSAQWVAGYDTEFQRQVYSELGGRLGRTVPRE